MTEFDYEKEKLKEILEKYILELEELGIRVKRLPEMYRDNPTLLANLLSIYENASRLKHSQLVLFFYYFFNCLFSIFYYLNKVNSFIQR